MIICALRRSARQIRPASSLLRTRHHVPSKYSSSSVIWSQTKRQQLSLSASSVELTTGSEIEEDWLDFLRPKKSRLDPRWLNRLERVQRPAAKALISQLTADNELGFVAATGPAKKGTLLEYVMQQKSAHPDKVILTRVGEFYETYGVDAIMLVEHCGLNPMGSKAKAGCPVRNVQVSPPLA
jgi:hypothetical protein